MRQCIAAGAFATSVAPYCFVRDDNSSTTLADASSVVPAEHELGRARAFRWRLRFRARREVELLPTTWTAALSHLDNTRLGAAPSSMCADHCNLHGTCVQERSPHGGPRRGRAWCQCEMGYMGRACRKNGGVWSGGAAEPSATCFRSCGGRGRCVHGSCVCERGSYGPGCVFPFAAAASTGKDATHLRVYVYDLPRMVTARRGYASDDDRQEIFSLMQHFTSALLGDPAHLTDEPSSADVFVVPALTTNMEGLTQYSEHVAWHLQHEYGPWFNRSHGADHVWFISSDHGGMIAPRKASRGIYMAHYYTSARLAANPRHLNPAPYLGLGVTAEAQSTYAGYGTAAWDEANRRRTLTLFFAGNMNLADTSDHYSEGVRRRLWLHHANTSGFRIVERSATYVDDYRRSVFCAAPLGEGWGIRLVWSIALGCIPVVFASRVRQPWDDLVEYGDFSVRVRRDQIPSLPSLLRAIGEPELARLRRGLAVRHRLFLWEQPYGLAYNVSMRELCRRAKLRRPELDCGQHLRGGYELAAGELGRGRGAAAEQPGPERQLAATAAAATPASTARRLLGMKQRAKRKKPARPPHASLCSSSCSAHEALYAQIPLDLAPFRAAGGITKAHIDSGLRKWAPTGILASIMLHNGSMYMTRPCEAGRKPVRHDDPMLLATLRLIWELVTDPAVPPLPDVELLINADDYGRVSLRDSKEQLLPLLSITKKLGHGADILYPTGHYTIPSETARDVTYYLGEHPASHPYLYNSTWEAKKEVAFFRGRPNTHSRSRLAIPRLALGSPSRAALLDVALVWYEAAHDWFVHTGGEPPLGAPVKPVRWREHLGHKYLLNLDGHSYAHRLLRILSTNSVVLKEESLEVEFYYHLLRPYVHYVPFYISVNKHSYKMADVRTNLTETIQWARAHDAECRAIATEAQRLVHTHLCDAARRCYVERLLREYGEVVAYRPSPESRPGAVRVRAMKDLIDPSMGGQKCRAG